MTDFQTMLSYARAHHLARFAAVLVIMVAACTAPNGGQTGSKRSGDGSRLAPLPVNTALTESAAVAWADAALDALGAPATTANVRTMVDWFANEGTPHDLNNPLNLQTPHGGSTTSTADGDPVDDHIQAYPTPADFVAAFPLEMNSGGYPAIGRASLPIVSGSKMVSPSRVTMISPLTWSRAWFRAAALPLFTSCRKMRNRGHTLA